MKLKEALEQKRFVVTSEIQAPLGDDDPEALIDRLKKVRGRVDGVSVSEVELEGVVGDNIKTCDLLKQNRFNAIYQTTTRDKNRFQLQKDLTAAHDTGVENLLVFTEDYRISGDSLQESMFFHVDSGKIASVLEHLKEGRTIDGKELPDKVDFTLGSGVEAPWGKNVPKRGMEEMEDMMNVGTGYFLTTPIFDVDQFAKFMKQVNTFNVPVIAEVMILRTAGMGKFLNRHFKSGMVPDWVIQKLLKAPDKAKASVELFAETVNSLKELCQGVHIITIGGEDKLGDYLNAAKLR
ncbi:MAG: methylenetetrahydrofolate reductase [Desulfobacteraceae bacterium]|jgi:methylenetetrahydrofolate reductase (NADPH)|nr:methylenetetrahydrofolate reductase [Desulfobacteraceae bacterium]